MLGDNTEEHAAEWKKRGVTAKSIFAAANKANKHLHNTAPLPIIMSVLSRDEILKAVKAGKIEITDFKEENLGPGKFNGTKLAARESVFAHTFFFAHTCTHAHAQQAMTSH